MNLIIFVICVVLITVCIFNHINDNVKIYVLIPVIIINLFTISVIIYTMLYPKFTLDSTETKIVKEIQNVQFKKYHKIEIQTWKSSWWNFVSDQYKYIDKGEVEIK